MQQANAKGKATAVCTPGLLNDVKLFPCKASGMAMPRDSRVPCWDAKL